MDQTLPPKIQGAAVALHDAQRARMTFRDASCRVADDPMRGGSAERLFIYGSLRQMNIDRTAEEMKGLVAY